MGAPRNRPHILVPAEPRVDGYTRHPRGSDSTLPPPASTIGHVRTLRASLAQAVRTAAAQRAAIALSVTGAKPGTYLRFQSKPNVPLDAAKLHNGTRKIELLTLRADKPEAEGDPSVQWATVFVPPTKEVHFENAFDEYIAAANVPAKERPKRELVHRVSTLELAALQGLWTDSPARYPQENEVVWWEVWLRNGDRALERWMEFSTLQAFKVGRPRIEFEDRIVTLARASAKQLAPAMLVLEDLAELRGVKTLASFFIGMPATELKTWSADLLQRCEVPEPDAPAVCVLDSGVNHGHPLLEGLLNPEDCHAYDPAWGTDDHHGHGTEMAGLAAYGDLTTALEASSVIPIRNRLESVKILPRKGDNDPKLYAAITADATSRVEIKAPHRNRAFAMAITADAETDRGQPTAWSAAIDALAAGRSFDPSSAKLVYLDADPTASRLFVLSAGNVGVLAVEHLDRSDTEPVQDPAQSWNALTVGACTEQVEIQDPALATWRHVSPSGELAPFSTTSVTFDKEWPIKPDVVLEGGNAAHDGAGTVDVCRDLSLLTTHHQPSARLLVDTCGTSAAAAQAARLAASVMGAYPDYWPETIRALVVHSAQWSPAMRAQLDPLSGKRARANLLRRYGFGVPSLERAVRSANDALTLVTQRTIRPFAPVLSVCSPGPTKVVVVLSHRESAKSRRAPPAGTPLPSTRSAVSGRTTAA